LRDGIDVLDRHAQLINSLGPTSWSNLAKLSRTNYHWRLEGTTCRLKLIARKVSFQMPKEATTLIIENLDEQTFSRWQLLDDKGSATIARAGECVLLPKTLTGSFSIQATTGLPAAVGNGSSRKNEVALFRRLLTEGRDRLLC
jgi:hypothetical protein